jgi:hypothetical protein
VLDRHIHFLIAICRNSRRMHDKAFPLFLSEKKAVFMAVYQPVTNFFDLHKIRKKGTKKFPQIFRK